MMTTFQVIGKTDGPDRFVQLDEVEFTRNPLSGDIVQEGAKVYRVYDSGNKGLRYWNVTEKWQQINGGMQQ
jgi:hypothetical protein